MAKKKTTKKKRKGKIRAGKAIVDITLDAAVLESVSVLLITLQSAAAVKAASIEKLDLTEPQAEYYIDAARERLAQIASCDLVEELGKATARLHNLYERAVGLLDLKTALGIQKELNRLLDLHRRPGDDGDGDGGELATVREHLAALDLTDDPDAPISELARLAALRIMAK